MNRWAYDLLSLSPLWVNRSCWEHVNIPINFVERDPETGVLVK
jgi:hypothetical protein